VSQLPGASASDFERAKHLCKGQSALRTCQALILCFVATGNSALVHGSATLGRNKRNKDFRLATPGSSTKQIGLKLKHVCVFLLQVAKHKQVLSSLKLCTNHTING